MENKKKIPAIVATTIILLSFLMVAFEVQTTLADSITGDYAFVNGVLASDKYSLYPFAKKSLTIGFSKYGELVDDRNNIGLEYGAVDPFAAPAGSAVGSIPKVLWIQGWLLNISYYNIPQGKNRNVWAYAAFSDANTYGGSWIRVDFANDWSATYGWEDPRDPGYIIGNYGAGGLNFGGRKTNGTAVTQPITVLYNGPRLFVALLNTTIYDHPVFLSDSTANDIPLARVLITIIFNKVKKEVVLLKDVKSLLTEKTGVSMNIQFSNRGEVDLGTEATGYHSNFHFFTQGTALNDTSAEGQSTVYNRDWTACLTVDLGADSAVGGMPQASGATYDVAQAINTGAGYVWWAAFWPSLSDWTIDGWGIHWKSMTEADPHWVDGNPDSGGEPRIPFYIGEWDFRLYAKEYALTNPIEFRGVTVYGVTDLNDGSDATRKIDTEVKYQLNEVFNPWDLAQAVEKDTTRWVQFYTVTAEDALYASYGIPLYIYLDNKPVLRASVWEEYCSFSERVLWGGALKTPMRSVKAAYDYELYTLPDGTGYIWIPATKVPAAGTVIKILYSTATEYGYEGSITLANFTLSDIQAEQGYILDEQEWELEYSMEDWLGAYHDIKAGGYITIREIDVDTTENHTWTYKGEINAYAYDVKVFKEDTATVLGLGDLDLLPENVTDVHENVTEVSISDVGGWWDVNSPDLLDLHIDYLDVVINWTVTIDYNATSGNYTVNVLVTAEPWDGNDYLYVEHIPGRYEWVTVGRDAHTVDSLGAALVSAAYKNKQVEIGLGGMDMKGTTDAYNIPYTLHKFGTGNALQDYFLTPDTSTPGQRLCLRDDWCTYWPVASSNIIAVGGPLANFVSLYFNDFLDAFYGAPWFTPYADWSGGIAALTCWNRNAYKNTATLGYATIGTYKDINGTVGLMVWGLDARDTYYATQWLHGDAARGIAPGIMYLQGINPGVTSIILKINYLDPEHPTFAIMEHLGTISEKVVIHQDP